MRTTPIPHGMLAVLAALAVSGPRRGLAERKSDGTTEARMKEQFDKRKIAEKMKAKADAKREARRKRNLNG